jgi:hypothetical protein
MCLEPAAHPAGGVTKTGPGGPDAQCSEATAVGTQRLCARLLGEWGYHSGLGARASRAPPRLSSAHGGRARVGQAAGRRAAGLVRLGGAHGGRARGGAGGRTAYSWGSGPCSALHFGRSGGELLARTRFSTTTRLSVAHGGRARGGRRPDGTCLVPPG